MAKRAKKSKKVVRKSKKTGGWFGDKKGHSLAAKKGWRGRKK